MFAYISEELAVSIFRVVKAVTLKHPEHADCNLLRNVSNYLPSTRRHILDDLNPILVTLFYTHNKHILFFQWLKLHIYRAYLYTVELGYNVKKGTEYFESL
jgi:hypothetical protein